LATSDIRPAIYHDFERRSYFASLRLSVLRSTSRALAAADRLPENRSRASCTAARSVASIRAARLAKPASRAGPGAGGGALVGEPTALAISGDRSSSST